MQTNNYDYKNIVTLNPENINKTIDYSIPLKINDLNHNTISYDSCCINKVINNPNRFSKNSSLKYEIDNLDNEIKNLQNRLKYMIDDKKK